MFRAAIPKHCVLALLNFILLALINAPSGLRKAIPGVVDLLPDSVLIPIRFHVHEFINAVGLFKIICQYSFDTTLVFLAYLCSAEFHWKEERYVGWLAYKGKPGDVLRIPELHLPSTKRDRNALLVK